MRKTALLLGTLALMFPAPMIRSYGQSADPRHIFTVSLANNFDIHLSLEIHIARLPKWYEEFRFHKVVRSLESDSFTLSLKPEDGTRLITLDSWEDKDGWDPDVFH